MYSTEKKLKKPALDDSLPDDVVLRVDNVSKKFCKDLRHSMVYGIKDLTMNLLGVQQGEPSLRSDEFWAVKDVSFELKRGECLGLIGHNGCGKTTLLRLLAGIFPPDKGEISIRGRVGALISLGAGFHPHMSGRENVYLNGSILGMHRSEIDERFDDIVHFAEIGDFIDAPVASYSSGMSVRLGFSVATCMCPDLLLIDEILAVGDVGFRAKCYNRISSMMKQSAVIFVSHSMSSVARVSSKCMLLSKSEAAFHGSPHDAILRYYSVSERSESEVHSNGVRLLNCVVNGEKAKGDYLVMTANPLKIELDIHSDFDVENVVLMICFNPVLSDVMAAEWNSRFNGEHLSLCKGRQLFTVFVDTFRLNPGMYNMSLVIDSAQSMDSLLWVHYGWTARVLGKNIGNAPYELGGALLSEPVSVDETQTV